MVRNRHRSSWAQYSILLKDEDIRDGLQEYLKNRGIPTMIYYPKPLSQQRAFQGMDCLRVELSEAKELCQRVLALPIHPYITEEEQNRVVEGIKDFIQSIQNR